MSLVVLQPASNDVARTNYTKTVKRLIELEKVRSHVPSQIHNQLIELYPEGEAPIWGVKPKHRKPWERIQKGNVILFARDNAVFSAGVITLRISHEPLALELWGRDEEDDQTWQLIYFLDEIRAVRIPYKDLNRVVDYRPKNVIRRFTVLDREKSRRILRHFDLDSAMHFPDISEADYRKAITLPSNNLDLKIEATVRAEQGFLRRYLFGGKKVGICGICGEEFPVGLLVTAHIKKRKQCSQEEKLDYQNIVMPMCRFGCDYLYERGIIGVKSGEIIALREEPYTPVVEAKVSGLIGNGCSYWNEKSAGYFAWHVSQWS
jgi:hypothetical protein